ncbi:MAG TPA: ABC transporter permease [Dehalococcoidia bacterium]|nr:ABC transporter permease [Dehalococcoidia bacterium]
MSPPGPSETVMGRPTVVIEPRNGLLRLDLGQLYHYRELLYFLIWRDVKIRYKQTAIGVAWAVIQPLATMALFTLVFGRFAGVPSDGLPYPVFAYAALLPWHYFSQAVTESGRSLVGDANLIRKVYFPRLVIPLAAVIRPLVDFSCSFLVLLVLMAWFGLRPSWPVLMLPALVALAVLAALAVGVWLSALNVRYRDVGHTIPFLTQLWLFASPVAYPVSVVPDSWRLIYSLNPMVGVIEGFRWALLGKASADPAVLLASLPLLAALLITGLIYFRRTEHTFADIV